jgi:hypothetical protein
MVQKLHTGLPPVVRRTPEARFEALFRKLVETGLGSVKVRGYPVWPKSIQRKLAALGFKPNDTDVYAQCSALARQLFTEAGHIQALKDQRKSTLDWHGHYNHQAVVGNGSGLKVGSEPKKGA